ncbi:hypothetical protein AAFN85_03690 [Mucilaginibacter sp. CAU 1740]|uniref:hypothetical protein n=1 Tax=Mucilaginibacter sp. CAU 1740 TaxID=3140365 RepID=UPI00325C1CA8
MFSLFRKAIRTMPADQSNDPSLNFKWYDPGDGNPLNKRILDIRPYTQYMISTTNDWKTAERFITNRKITGEEYKGFEFKGAISVNAQLTYPHNGKRLEGICYKASEMEDKWDIYIWDDIIYFVRSWTSVVAYKAFVNYSDDKLIIHKVEFETRDDNESESLIAINNVHFLISTLAGKTVMPHTIPGHLKTYEEIARYSFSLFGRNCWYATYEDILDTTITPSEK